MAKKKLRKKTGRKLSVEHKISLAFGKHRSLLEKTTPSIVEQTPKDLFKLQVMQKINSGKTFSEAVNSVLYTREYFSDIAGGSKATAEAKWYHREFMKGLGKDDKERKKIQFKYYKNVKNGSLSFSNLRFVKSYSKLEAEDHVELGIYYIRQTYEDTKSGTYIHIAFTDNDSKTQKVILIENEEGIRVL